MRVCAGVCLGRRAVVVPPLSAFRACSVPLRGSTQLSVFHAASRHCVCCVTVPDCGVSPTPARTTSGIPWSGRGTLSWASRGRTSSRTRRRCVHPIPTPARTELCSGDGCGVAIRSRRVTSDACVYSCGERCRVCGQQRAAVWYGAAYVDVAAPQPSLVVRSRIR